MVHTFPRDKKQMQIATVSVIWAVGINLMPLNNRHRCTTGEFGFEVKLNH